MDYESVVLAYFFFFQAEDGIRDLVRSRGLGDVYKRQMKDISVSEFKTVSFINVGVIMATFLLLNFTRIAPPFIVLGCLLLGFVV